MDTVSLLLFSYDCLLALSLLWISWQIFANADLFRSIVLFIAFGLLMALVWVRLDAPDIALAEAAIGAGLTGALLLSSLARLDETAMSGKNISSGLPVRLTYRSLLTLVIMLVGGGLAYVIQSLPDEAEGLTAVVIEQLNNSGVSNPVTAVLLNFRGYDTLLEIMVLLLALLGVWSLKISPISGGPPAGAMLDYLVRLLIPVLILVAAYLLWVGAHAPGGAFQAGSVLAAACVLLLLAGWNIPDSISSNVLRILVILGPVTFVITSLLSLYFNQHLLAYPAAYAGQLILLLEAAATLSIGFILAALFLGNDPSAGDSK